MSDPADTQRLIGDIVRLGTVASVDLGARTCTVTIGDLTTSDLPWLTGRAGKTRHWSPPSLGEQCVIISPEGDTEAAIVLPGLYSNANPAPASADNLDHITFGDGAVMSYDAEAHLLTITLPDAGRMHYVAPGGILFDADAGVRIKGTLSVSDNHAIGNGATGTFTSPTGQVIVVQNGVITDISA